MNTDDPQVEQYCIGLASAMSAAGAQIKGNPQQNNPLMRRAQHVPSNINYVNIGQGVLNPVAAYGSPSACVFNNSTAMNNYTDALVRAGASCLDINIDPMVATAASQYQGALQSNSWWAGTLANYDAMIAHAQASGLKICLRPCPDSVVAAAGFTAATSEMEFESVYTPLLAALAARWPTIWLFDMAHEFFGDFGSAVPFKIDTTWAKTWLTNTAAAIRAVAPAILLSAAAETMYSADAKFFSLFLTLKGVLDRVGVDLFASTWDPSQYTATALATAQSWAAQAAGAGLPIAVHATSRPPLLAPTATNFGEASSLIGAGNIIWQQNGADDLWFQGVIPYLAAAGYDGISPFLTEILIWYTTDGANDNAQTSAYPKNVMSNLSANTPTAAVFAETQPAASPGP